MVIDTKRRASGDQGLEKTMKIAQQLAALNVNEAQEQAEQKAIAKDQIWGGEGYTKYTFEDNSVLIQSGPTQYGLDADSLDSIKGYEQFLGDDVALEAEEIARLADTLE